MKVCSVEYPVVRSMLMEIWRLQVSRVISRQQGLRNRRAAVPQVEKCVPRDRNVRERAVKT